MICTKKISFAMIISIICCLMGIYVFITAGRSDEYKHFFNKTAKKTKATITDIEVDRDYGSRRSKRIYKLNLSYTIDGKDYTQVIEKRKKEYSKGDEVTIYYLEQFPTAIKMELYDIRGERIKMRLLSGIMIIIFGYFTYLSFKKQPET